MACKCACKRLQNVLSSSLHWGAAMINVHRTLTVTVVVAVFCANIGAQSDSGGSTPTIRTNTRLVLVDVVATDKHGKAVTDLKASDFTVQEKGKNQKIAIFNPPGSAEPGAAQGLGPVLQSSRIGRTGCCARLGPGHLLQSS